MEDRIQINGIWYCREDAQEENLCNIEELDIITTMSYLYETDDYCWEATRAVDDDGVFVYPTHIDFGIKFTDKRTALWKEKCWDNPIWVLGILESDADAMVEATKSMSREGIVDFRKFIKFLIEKEWIEKKS